MIQINIFIHPSISLHIYTVFIHFIFTHFIFITGAHCTRLHRLPISTYSALHYMLHCITLYWHLYSVQEQ